MTRLGCPATTIATERPWCSDVTYLRAALNVDMAPVWEPVYYASVVPGT